MRVLKKISKSSFAACVHISLRCQNPWTLSPQSCPPPQRHTFAGAQCDSPAAEDLDPDDHPHPPHPPCRHPRGPSGMCAVHSGIKTAADSQFPDFQSLLI